MKAPTFFMAAALFCVALPAPAKEPAAPSVKDDANQSAYANGWSGSGGGSGFGDWTFQETHGEGESYAGHLIADAGTNPEMATVGTEGKAFGLYANGSGFETASAFRTFSAPLQIGSVFSFLMYNGLIEQKGAKDDPGQGSVGLTLRSDNSAGSPDDYHKEARLEIVNLKGLSNYQVYDGEAVHDTGVVYSEKGIKVSVTLTGADTYDLEISSLGTDAKPVILSGRKFSGSGAITSFCIFDRNGEKADGFFNSFQVRGKGK